MIFRHFRCFHGASLVATAVFIWTTSGNVVRVFFFCRTFTSSHIIPAVAASFTWNGLLSPFPSGIDFSCDFGDFPPIPVQCKVASEFYCFKRTHILMSVYLFLFYLVCLVPRACNAILLACLFLSFVICLLKFLFCLVLFACWNLCFLVLNDFKH